MIKVSVIVPVYNAEKYIAKCLNSIINQTLIDIEIILVLNGVTDDTKKIIKTYKDSRIKLYELSVASISKARNKGIEESSGEYCLFFDADDYMEPDMVTKLYNKAIDDELDMVFSDYYSVINNKKEYTKLIEIDVVDANNQKVIDELNYGPIKLFKTSIIKNKKIQFPDHLKYEDIYFVVLFLENSKKIGKINEALFNYVIHENSEQTTIDKRVFDLLTVIDLSISKVKNKSLYENMVVNILTTFNIKQRYQTNKQIRNKFINETFKYLLVNYPNYKKCDYLRHQNVFKRIIKKHKLITKLYCNVYNLAHKG